MPDSTTMATHSLIELITSQDPSVRDQPLERICASLDQSQLLAACEALEAFRDGQNNLYHRVRALFFLYAIHRFYLPRQLAGRESGQIPIVGYESLLSRRFSEAIRTFQSAQSEDGPSITLSSALASAYYRLGIQTLADQVRLSVRTVAGNRWMFRTGHPSDMPLRFRSELVTPSDDGEYPVLRERTSVRMDFSHSGWSDIFFLGMDYPEAAQVINASINLAVRGKHTAPQPPIECAVRVIDRPVLRMVSIDLGAQADIRSIGEVFDFGRDYLGLLKAAVIAAGLVPPGMEGCSQSIEPLLLRLVGAGRGIELVSRVNEIPKGSRLAVSTNLLGSLISACMRATGQVTQLTGPLAEGDRRIVAARAILGEWLGGSGGGWQDSGGIWPGIKLIQGTVAEPGDPEYGVSRGRLLPQHHVFDDSEVSPQTRQRLQDSLVLVHGGMAQNVGPILEMVTEKYLLRSEAEWAARQDALKILKQLSTALAEGDIKKVGALTNNNFAQPLQQMIPWCSNAYTEALIDRCRKKFGEQFWGFWMLGGMAGGGMGFLFDPEVKPQASTWLGECMLGVKRRMQNSLPFAMDPVVYDFEINDAGTQAQLDHQCAMPAGYYELVLPEVLKQDIQQLGRQQRSELNRVATMCRQSTGDSQSGLAARLIDRLLPNVTTDNPTSQSLATLLDQCGFDATGHQQLRADILSGRVSLAQNRLPSTSSIEDVHADDVLEARGRSSSALRAVAEACIENGEVAVMTLAAGVGSRWTQGAGVVKALNPFCKFDGRHRSFLDIHLAKSSKTGETYACYPPHIIATGYMTDQPIREYLREMPYAGTKYISHGKSVGLRMVPTVRDLHFAWEETQQQVLDEQQEKLRQSSRAALLKWATDCGEASDYVDNLPDQCLHPVGHWYEVPNLLLGGTLAKLLQERPQMKHLLLHNIDTLGATIDPEILALHLTSGACLSFEVITRRLEDRGGGLARVDGRPRLVEGLAMPNEEDEFRLSYYNSMTTWVDLNRLLDLFGLSRDMLNDQRKVDQAVKRLARRMPTYLTLKDVKKRWGNGQEDVFPVLQFEKLWGDMTALPEVDCQFIVVPTRRGQQLKDPAQLDGWLRDGSASYINSLCSW